MGDPKGGRSLTPSPHASTACVRSFVAHCSGRVVEERLRRAQTRFSSAPALLDALRRLTTHRALGVSAVELPHVPPTRLQALARVATTAWAPTIARMPTDRQIATLLAFAVFVVLLVRLLVR